MKGARPLTRESLKAILKATDSIREKALLTHRAKFPTQS